MLVSSIRLKYTLHWIGFFLLKLTVNFSSSVQCYCLFFRSCDVSAICDVTSWLCWNLASSYTDILCREVGVSPKHNWHPLCSNMLVNMVNYVFALYSLLKPFTALVPGRQRPNTRYFISCLMANYNLGIRRWPRPYFGAVGNLISANCDYQCSLPLWYSDHFPLIR